ERSAVELERKHVDVEGRKRYVETILDRIATGVVSVDALGRIGRANSAAARLLSVDASIAGRPASEAFGNGELQPLADVIDEGLGRKRDIHPSGLAIPRTWE